MKERDYFGRSFDLACITGVDRMSVHKYEGSDWARVEIQHTANDTSMGKIELRSLEAAEALYYMLSRLLDK